MASRPWILFLLREIPEELLVLIRDDALEGERSLSDLMRSILCSHYELDCPPSGSASKYGGSNTLLLRLQPELFDTIKADAAALGTPMRALILDILEAHYMEVPA